MRWPNVFIAVFLAVQIVLPLNYYWCRGDKYDERFAWRMFSPERGAMCTPRFEVGKPGGPMRAVSLGAEFHQAWKLSAERGRVTIVERMADHLCDKYKDEAVHLELRCQKIDGSSDLRAFEDDACHREATP